MTTDLIFVEQYIADEYWHWKYQYYCDEFSYAAMDKLYDWCLANLGPTIDWHVRNNGVIMLKEEDAMAFKLTWL